jgi:hypothetical protein
MPSCPRTTYTQAFRFGLLDVPAYVFTFELFLASMIVMCAVLRIKEYWPPARTSVRDPEAMREDHIDSAQAYPLPFFRTGVAGLDTLPYHDLESVQSTAHNDSPIAKPLHASVERILVAAHTDHSGDSQSKLQQAPWRFVAEEQEIHVPELQPQVETIGSLMC